MSRKIGAFWFTTIPVLFLAALLGLSLVNLATNLSMTRWLLENRTRHLAGFLMILAHNLSVFYACWRIWQLPLTCQARLQTIGWALFWSPAALPAWRWILLPTLEQQPGISSETNPTSAANAMRRFNTFCLRTMVAYLIILSFAILVVEFSFRQH